MTEHIAIGPQADGSMAGVKKSAASADVVEE
jgi:hypothetical protein